MRRDTRDIMSFYTVVTSLTVIFSGSAHSHANFVISFPPFFSQQLNKIQLCKGTALSLSIQRLMDIQDGSIS